MLRNNSWTENHTYVESSTKHSDGVIALLIAVHVFLMGLTVTGNSLICAAVYRFRALRTPSNFILSSLAILDLVMGVVFVKRIVLLALGRHYRLACHATSELAFATTCLILLHLCLISVERLLAIKYPLRYPSIITKSRAIILLILTWFVGIFGTLVVPHIQGIELDGFGEIREDFHVGSDPNHDVDARQFNLKKPYPIFLISLYFYLPFAIIVFSYGYIFKVSLEQRKRVRREANSFKRISTRRRRNIELKAVRTLGLVVGVFTLCFVPLFSGLVFQQFINNTQVKDILRIFSLIASSSSCINPIVYTWGNLEFRKAFKIILTFRRKEPLDVSEKVAFSTTAGLITNGSTVPHKIMEK